MTILPHSQMLHHTSNRRLKRTLLYCILTSFQIYLKCTQSEWKNGGVLGEKENRDFILISGLVWVLIGGGGAAGWG